MKIERPRGTRDFLPDEMEKRRAIEAVMRRIAESYGYREIATPTFEHLELFTIKSGEGIVEELYAFKDKGGRDLALRPELTAPVMRLFVNECSVMPRPLRFYYFANCFRYERPQKGRYREFWQFGVELIGSSSHLSDAEVIALAYRIMDELNLDFELHIGHVGLLRHLLKDIEEDRASKIMRLIDKKDVEGLSSYLREINAPEELAEKIYALIELTGSRDVLVEASRLIPDFDMSHMEKLCDVLDSMNVNYVIDLGIARGLDYYTGVVFEAYAKHGLGAQKQICGGGSYRLTHLFGGEDVPSTGFALGFDRIAEICEITPPQKPVIVVVNVGFEGEAFRIAEELRKQGFRVVTDVMERNIRKQFSYANDINASFAVVVGKREIESGRYTLKNMVTGEHYELSFEELVKHLSREAQLP
ncbi:histidine--tRNA ligase [Archaeoglobus veneficus]|uniref:Histidine--tRNA ligase n=1 Tax=Archaeoglobus veneficus (strain DSM 11195 / SNP6) TaxID=693661 RepID=F2KT46_ARCVS|nr:histidine--tRNA ligase [Archaeoglobus veneficus]AEA47076.1 ATP phosphoribosyltransferase regulatory subunit [Archaeoglobus veneficus SNP6]